MWCVRLCPLYGVFCVLCAMRCVCCVGYGMLSVGYVVFCLCYGIDDNEILKYCVVCFMCCAATGLCRVWLCCVL